MREDISIQKNDVELGSVLDFCTQPIIFLNFNFEVFYFNFRTLHFCQTHEKAFSKCDQDFKPNILNTHLRIFEEKLANRLNEMFALSFGQMLVERIQIDYLHLELRITPLFSVTNEKLGCCIEIHDQTELWNTLDLINTTIQNAQEGLFDTSIPMQSVSNEYEILPQIGQKINTLFETIHGFFGEMACAFEALINGELFYSMPMTTYEKQYPESFFSSTKMDFNYVLRNLCTFVRETKKSSRLMMELLNQILMKNSELAMTSEKENTEAMHISAHIQHFFEMVRSTHFEINQAVEIANNLHLDPSALDDLHNVFHTLRTQLKTMAENTQYMNFLFKEHLNGFQTALQEIHIGNIGKGIFLVNSECEALMKNTTNLMYNIQDAVQKINTKVDHSFEHVLKKVSLNNHTMHDAITLMSSMLNAIRQTLESQDNQFESLQTSIFTLHSSHQETTTRIENTFLLSSVMIHIIEDLNIALGKFVDQDQAHLVAIEENLKEEIEQLLLMQYTHL